MKILIVEAEQAAAAWLSEVLSERNHRTKHVTCGSQGLMASLADEFDLLVCDVQLPDLHGTEIVRALKAQSPMLPVMTLGDGDAEQWSQVCLDAGASCYLQKPIGREALLQEVTLVEKARLKLKTILIDTDPIHRRRLARSLNSLGCEVVSFGGLQELDAQLVGRGALLVLDADADGAMQTLSWARQQGAACFVFKEHYDPATEEALMRHGAALLMQKPVDIDQLLTQAAFLAGM
jgi:DNA-binding response OmpR family regulator